MPLSSKFLTESVGGKIVKTVFSEDQRGLMGPASQSLRQDISIRLNCSKFANLSSVFSGK